MERSVKVRLDLAIAGFQANAARAVATTRAIGHEVEKTSRKSKQEMQTVGTAAAVMGGAIVGALALSSKAAIDFESSFAGVRKTVNATEAEFAQLASGMRDMARSIPTNVNELNAIGEAAGQLGIKTENLLGFTRTMADLGETTNLSADEAATSLARLANITQMPQTEFDRLGSTIVALGNNFATTEAEIVEMGQRIAGAGAQVGMTEAQILSISAALSSLGINAEAGGTAISKVMIDIASHVANNTEDLATFADVAGMSAEQFAQAWQQDAAGALGEFVTGLGQMEERGGSTLQVLEQLGITEVRMRDALLRASGAGELWAQAGFLANRAWEENTALAAEAEQRYQTTAARIDLMRNSINDAGITIGQTFSPAIAGAADTVAGFAGTIADLPPAAAAGVAGVGALGGAASLAAGGFLLAAPRIVETKQALDTLSSSMPKTVRAMRAIPALLTGPWGIAIGGAVTMIGLLVNQQAQARASAEEWREAIDETTGALNDQAETIAVRKLEEEGAIERARKLGLSTRVVTEALLGYGPAQDQVAQAIEKAKREADAYIDANHTGSRALEEKRMAAGGLGLILERLSGNIREISDETRETAINTAEGAGRFLDMKHALDSGLDPSMARLAIRHQEVIDAQQEGQGAAGALGGEFDALAGDVGETQSALEAYLDTLQKATDPVYALQSAIHDVDQAQRDYDEAVKKHGKGSQEAADAAWELSQRVADAEAAAIDGDLSFDAFTTKLRDWVAQGTLTADQADAIRERVAELRGEAETYASSYTAYVYADTSEALAQLRALGGTIQSLAGQMEYVDAGVRSVVNRHADALRPRENHSGGPAGTGPIHTGPLKGDEVPAVLQTGEFVLSRKMVAALGGLPALQALLMHDGGPVGAASGLSAASGTAALQAAIARLDATLQEMDKAEERRQQERRRTDLVQGVHSAQQAFDTATDPDARAEAWERLVAAYEQLGEFDRARVVAAERAAVADAQAQLAAELRLAANREEFEFAQMSTSEQIKMLSDQLRAETRFTDEWMDLHSQRARLVEQTRSEMLSGVADLNRMLDERARLLEEQEKAERDHQANIANIWADANDRIAGLVADRAETLRVGMGHDGFDHRAGALADQLSRQTSDLKAWARELDQLRGRGVSDLVIDMLGLEEGPEALGQIRQLAASSQEELEQLEAAAREREKVIAAQVRAERKDRTTALGQDVLEIRRQANADVEAATQQHNEEMAQLGEELAAIGLDTGRSYSDAVAEGLASGIPGIRQHVREVQKLMRDLKEAEASVSGEMTVQQMLATPQVRDAVVSAGHDPRSTVDLADVAAALRKLGHDFGSRVDLADIQHLLKASSVTVHAPRDASSQQIAEDLAWVLQTAR